MASKSITNTGTTYSSINYKVDAGSGYFNGSNSHLSILDNADFHMGSGNFTVDFWVYITSFAKTNQVVFSNMDQGTGSSGMSGWVDNNYLEIDIYGGGYNASPYVTWSPSANTWYHIAMVRNGTTSVMFFVNGVQQGATQTIANANQLTASTSFYIGNSIYNGSFYPNWWLSGYVDEFRVSKGIARWTSNFTPQTTAYTTDAYTALLVHFEETNGAFTDSSGGGTTYMVNVSDSFSFSDSAVKSIGLHKSDSFSSSDSVTQNIGLHKSDSFSSSDSAVKSIGLHKSDSFSSSDSITQNIGLHKSDSFYLTDSVEQAIYKTIADFYNSADNVNITKNTIHLTVSDNISFTDSISIIKHSLLQLNENFRLTESVSQKNISLFLHENIGIVDNIIKQIQIILTDSYGINDNVIIQKLLPYIFNALFMILD